MVTHPPVSLPHSPPADQIVPLLSVCLPPAPFTISSTSMEVGSTASASNPLTSNGIPLIICTDCNRRRVVRRVSTKPWSKGEVFFCCPTHKVSVDCVPCDFLHFCCFGTLILDYHFSLVMDLVSCSPMESGALFSTGRMSTLHIWSN